MSIQEMKRKIHHLVDNVDDEGMLEELLNSANVILADPSTRFASLSALTDTQRQDLEKAIQEHKDGKTVSHSDMQQRHRKWLNR